MVSHGDLRLLATRGRRTAVAAVALRCEVHRTLFKRYLLAVVAGVYPDARSVKHLGIWLAAHSDLHHD